MVRVIWLPKALADLDQIRAYIRQFDPRAADKLSKRLIEVGGSLAEFPNRGRPARDGRREMTTAPPYVLRYAVSGGTVFITDVLHGARRRD